MGTYQKLHLANNLDALDLLAKRDCDVRKYKFTQICNVLSKLYQQSQLNVLDQEKTYILLVRYLNVYNHLKNTQPDKKFLELRFGSEYEKVLMQYEGIKKSLEERYNRELKEVVNVPAKPIIDEKEVPTETKSKCIFDDEFITCQQLFSALQKKYNILLVDARPDKDFAESRIDNFSCINVPDHCIASGLSANALGKMLPPDSHKLWEKRDTYDVIILYDWNTSLENFSLTKLHKLRSALIDWDVNRNYHEQPVVLKGGYLELLQTYPTLCANPHVYLYQKNNELDELLELDNIKYPTETDNKSLVMGVPEDEENEDVTKEALIQENKEITVSREEVISKLQHEEDERKKINDMCNQENNIKNIMNLKKRDSEIGDEITRLEKLLEDLNKKRSDVKKKFEMNFQYDIEQEDKEPEKIGDDSEKLKDIIDEERSKELLKARALKPKTDNVINNKNKVEVEKPVINRATKPNSLPQNEQPRVEPLNFVTAGLVGLRNIRNTCYMNTVVQCFRNIPAIKQLFCTGTYAKYIIRNPAAIIHETSRLIRQLWSMKSVKSIEPSEFFETVIMLEQTYRLGNHEDCMEFFLFLLNHLSEDCCYHIPLPTIMTPKQRAWYNQFQGKNSVFIDLFYHQIRIIQNCHHCERKTYKFEIESTFMLSVPEHDFDLVDLMKEYMADFIISDYCCAQCKRPVNNQKEICYEPKIMVIVLKRYRQCQVNGVLTLKKVDSRAHFPKKNFRLGSCLYQLNAIALHSGDMNYGHYTAAALTPKGWHEFNDEMVRPISINDDSVRAKACAFFYSMCDDKEN